MLELLNSIKSNILYRVGDRVRIKSIEDIYPFNLDEDSFIGAEGIIIGIKEVNKDIMRKNNKDPKHIGCRDFALDICTKNNDSQCIRFRLDNPIRLNVGRNTVTYTEFSNCYVVLEKIQ